MRRTLRLCVFALPFADIIFIPCCLLGVTRASSRLKVPCDARWTPSPSSGTCLKIPRDKLSWDSASQACKDLGGDLIKIKDTKMLPLIVDLLGSARDKFYIGVHGEGELGHFKWLDETYENRILLASLYNLTMPDPITSINVNETGAAYCLTLKSDLWLVLIDCTQEERYICEKGPELCPQGWVPSAASGTCIRVYFSEVSWDEARAVCQRHNGDLVKIVDSDMNSFLSNELISLGKVTYWIGLRYHHWEHQYQWLDDNDQVDLAPQGNNQSQGDNDGSCFYLFDEKWSSSDCTSKMRMICEKFSDCKNEKYGMVCPVDCESTHCGGSRHDCNRRTGVCLEGCEDGYRGLMCRERCGDHTYGANCGKRCSRYCAGTNKTCNHVTGNCRSGCVSGYMGTRCLRQVLRITSSSLQSYLIYGLVISFVAPVMLMSASGLLMEMEQLCAKKKKRIPLPEPSMESTPDKRTDVTGPSSHPSPQAETSPTSEDMVSSQSSL